jgi:hypothetical protein
MAAVAWAWAWAWAIVKEGFAYYLGSNFVN